MWQLEAGKFYERAKSRNQRNRSVLQEQDAETAVRLGRRAGSSKNPRGEGGDAHRTTSFAMSRHAHPDGSGMDENYERMGQLRSMNLRASLIPAPTKRKPAPPKPKPKPTAIARRYFLAKRRPPATRTSFTKSSRENLNSKLKARARN